MPIRRRAVTRLAALVAVTSLFGVAQLVGAAQTTVTFTDFSDKSSLQLNGVAIASYNPAGQTFLRLTQQLGPQGQGDAGSAFLKDAITLADGASFSTHFTFRITNPVGCSDADGQGADGITFVVQTVSNTAGGGGGGIGYGGIAKSVAVEFDTWWNFEAPTLDTSGNHIGIDLNGSLTSVVAKPITTRFNDGSVWNAWVDYNGDTNTIEARVSQDASRPAVADVVSVQDLPAILLQDAAFVGFTSGTGCAGGDHDILSWTFINDFNPVGLNAPPEANAGADQTVTQTGASTAATLNGSASTDPDGDTLSYSWSGPFAGGTTTGATPTVTFATAGAHTVTLTVNDGNGGTDTDDVVITVAAPSAAPQSSSASPSPTVRSDVLGGTSAPSAAALPDTATAQTPQPPAGALATVFALVGLVSAVAVARQRRAR